MSLFHRTTVTTGERLVEYVDGAFSRVLEPGRHATHRRAKHVRVVVRDVVDTLAPQDVPTSDGITVRVTASVRWRVVDPRAFVEVASTPFALVYLAVQVALRDAFASTPTQDIAAAVRSGLAERLTAAGSEAGDGVGIEVVTVVVKDVILPHELRLAYAEQITAKARGLAQLEAARAETAALRSLANGAKLLDEHPGLAKLRLIQALPPGSKVEIVAGT